MSNSDPRAQARLRALRSLRHISPEEDAAITAAAEQDADNPPLTEEDMAAFKPATPARRGRKIGPAGAKQLLTIRLDPDVIEHYRATGNGWQSRMNADLRKVNGLETGKRTNRTSP